MPLGERPWFCYMLECADHSLYVGVAVDTDLRVLQHNRGVGARHTRLRRPVKLVWREEHVHHASARSREAELKGWSRAKKLNLVAQYREIHPSPENRAQGEFSSQGLENSGE
jgi:predicted GIY-YIG superfamily endonuclease